MHLPTSPAVGETASSPGSLCNLAGKTGPYWGPARSSSLLPHPTLPLSSPHSPLPTLRGHVCSSLGTSGINSPGGWRRARPEAPTRSSIPSGANTTQEIAAKSQARVGWEQTTISLPRKTNWTCQEERNSSTSHTYGLILMDMYEHKGRRITFWLG